jgi:prepilin-type N-terminal cleavage/methylation domain-containing protein
MKRNQKVFSTTNPPKADSGGFTILELMIATIVFSIVLLLVTTGIIQIGKTYYKGVTQSRTQETARSIIDEISRGIQFSGEIVKPITPFDAVSTPYPQPGGKYGFCVNGVSYAYILDKQLAKSISDPTDQVDKTLISYSGACVTFSVQDVTTTSGKELLGLGMRLTDLNIVENANGTYTITVGVATGERELFDPATPAISSSCTNETGKQFCALSKLTVTVQKRVK